VREAGGVVLEIAALKKRERERKKKVHACVQVEPNVLIMLLMGFPVGPPATGQPQLGSGDWAAGGAGKRPRADGADGEGAGGSAAQPPAHDVFRQRRKQRSRVAGGEG